MMPLMLLKKSVDVCQRINQHVILAKRHGRRSISAQRRTGVLGNALYK